MITVEQGYVDWLVSITGKSDIYSSLLRHLDQREFVWLIPNDDNRMVDGTDLRDEFMVRERLSMHEVSDNWYNRGCSCLEMLIALARKASYESNLSPGDWFWLMVDNAGLRPFTDSRYPGRESEVDEIIDRVIYRSYDPDGTGGFFPLRNTDKDQRRVELWYQLAEYILEDFPP